MRFYRHVSYEEVVKSGKITGEELNKAIESGRVRVIKAHATNEEWLDGYQLHQEFGITDFSALRL